MATNVFIGPNSVVAKQTKSFVEIGFDEDNVSVIYEVGNSLKSWKPGRSINAITGITINKGYYLVSLVDADLTAFFDPNSTGSGVSSPYYEKTFGSVITASILQSEHGLTKIRGVTCLSPSGAVVEVYTEIRSGQEVYIESLLNLNNYKIILY